MTFSVPWSEKGDFVATSIKRWAERNGSTPSKVMLDALEWYFTYQTPIDFYDMVNSEIESAEFKRLHAGDKLCNRMSCESCYSKRNKVEVERISTSSIGKG